MLQALAHRLLRDTKGNVALTFALVCPVLVGTVGMAADSASFYNQKSHMQGVADSTALAAAKELHLFVDDSASIEAGAENRAEALLVEAGIADRVHTVEANVDSSTGIAEVTISMVVTGLLPADVWGENPVVVTAQARSYGQSRLCVLGLHASASETILADQAAILTAPECVVQSNSVATDGLVAKASSSIESLFTCSSGGVDGRETSFVPPPTEDCPPLPDPLSSRPVPDVGGCDYLDMAFDRGIHSISPGTYCGGLSISQNAEVHAERGVYIVMGGALEVSNAATLIGENVSFYFADDAAVIDFRDNSLIELSAPEDGPMAGILFYENPEATPGRSFTIASQSARTLLGTIYIPRGTFTVASRGRRVADASAYTIIVANQIEVNGGILVINADYGSTDIPVPEGVGPNGAQITLDR